MGLIENLKDKFGFSEGSAGSSIDIEMRHAKQMNFMTMMVAICVLIIAVLGASFSSVASKMAVTVEIPPSIYKEPSIKVGNGWANNLYLKVWSDWLVNETANFEPGTIKDKLNTSLRFFSQDKVGDYVGQLGALSNLIIRNQLKQVFTIKSVDATYYSDSEFQSRTAENEEIRSAVFVYNGVATQLLGRTPAPDRSCKYTVAVKLEGGHLYGYSYDTDCFK